jgi:hypothetical protein
MAAPERFAKRQTPLAPRAPSIHGPSRHFAAVQQTVALGGIATVGDEQLIAVNLCALG